MCCERDIQMKSKMAAKYIILISTFLICYLQDVEGQGCTEANIDKCIAPLEQYSDVLDGSIVPSHSIEVTKQICRTYRGVKDCMAKFEHNCHPVNRKSFQGVHDSYKYLCDDHFDEYGRHRECLATPTLHEEGKACNWTLHFSFNSDSYTSGTSSYKAKRICQYAKTYLSCVENLVSSFCGEEAAAWQRGYDESSLDPILSYIGCQLNPNDGERSAIIAGVVLTFVLVAVFILVGVGIWMYGKKKHAREARNRRAARNGGPPGGGGGPGGDRGSAVYRIGDPGSEGQVNISPYAYSTPSPVPPPYAEKPPAYGEMPQQANGNAMANGHGLHGTGAMAAAVPNAYEADTTKMPLPPDYEPGEYQHPGPHSPPAVHPPPGGEGTGAAPSTMAGSDYLELQVPPEVSGENAYEVIRGDSTRSAAGRAAQHHTDSLS